MKDEFNRKLDLRTNARGMLRYANDYFKAYKILLEREPRFLTLYQVKFFLLCHSIELALKADLKRRGYTRKQLLDLGHDLEKILKVLKEKHEVLLDVESLRQIFLANELYKTKQFEYSLTGAKFLADISKLESITDLILSKTLYWIEKEAVSNG